MLKAARNNNLQNDASFSGPPILPQRLTFEAINNLEEDLDFYEIVSLVFLLYDNAATALSQLRTAKITTKVTGKQVVLISDWIRYVKDKDPRWQETLLEALTIVQCYAALKKLGFSTDEMNGRFLPLNYECSINIHPVKKALYRFCESLSKDVVEMLTERIQTDLLKYENLSTSSFSTESQYLEMHILYWITIRYINISYDDTNDIKNLILVLDTMGMKILCSRLEMSVNRANVMYEQKFATQFSTKLQFDKSMETVQNSMTSLCSYYDIPESNRYEMNSKYAGIVIIINQKNFEPENLGNREGTDFDRDRLSHVWKKYGFEIIIHEDSSQIQNTIQESIDGKFLPEHCCLIVVILSHGKNGFVYEVDGNLVDIISIENTIRFNKKLLGKPKILIIQACQGGMLETAITLPNNPSDIEESDENHNLETDGPSKSRSKQKVAFKTADFYKIISSTPGYQSIRDTHKGTWLIQSFCNVLEENGAKDHFEDIIIATKLKVSQKNWNGAGMVTVIEPNTLIKFLYFIPVSDSFVKCEL